MKMRLLLAHLRGIARRLAMHVVSGSRAMPIPPIRMGNARREAGMLAIIPIIGKERNAERMRGVVAICADKEMLNS